MNKKVGGLYGALIGDAVGCPYEFKAARNIPQFELIDMIPPPGFNRSWKDIPVGTYTDDGAQVLVLLEVLLSGESDWVPLLHTRLRDWLTKGYMSVDKRTFDCGNQTRQALQYCSDHVEVMTTMSGENQSGNGSLMRCLPTALVAKSLKEAMVLATHQSLPTHPNRRCQMTCSIYSGIAYQMLQGLEADDGLLDVADLIVDLYPNAKQEIDFIYAYENHELTGSGYVVDALWSALHALRVGKTYDDVIRHAIAFGNDTDTTACIAGGLAGIKYGYEGIPTQWLELLRGKDFIEPLANKLGE